MDNILLLSLTLSLLFTTTVATVTSQELDAALFAIRSRGYNLFPNAITTSDIRLLLLSLNSTFTLFSPPDPLVYSLDLSSTTSLYIQSLLRHVCPLRLSMSDLRSIRSSPYLHTLNPPQRIVIDKYLVRDNGNVSESILLDGVRISVPDLFLGSAIAVHGLEGILVAEVGSNSREEHIGDSPSLSPVAAWSELNAPASSPTVEMGLRGPLSPDSWSEKRNGRRGHRTGNQRGFHDDLSNQSGQNHFAKYSRQFGA